MLGLLVTGIIMAATSDVDIVRQICTPPECIVTLSAPPPWQERTAIPLRGSEWLVGLPSDQLGNRLRKDVAFKNLLAPTALSLGAIEAHSKVCVVMIYTKPSEAGKAEVWSVNGFSAQWDPLDEAAALLCSASLRP